MTDAEETKRLKAKNLRFKKPICRDLNLDTIKENLYDIMCECEDIRWYTDSEDGEDTLINALAGDEDEAYEFKIEYYPPEIKCPKCGYTVYPKLYEPDCIKLPETLEEYFELYEKVRTQ